MAFDPSKPFRKSGRPTAAGFDPSRSFAVVPTVEPEPIPVPLGGPVSDEFQENPGAFLPSEFAQPVEEAQGLGELILNNLGLGMNDLQDVLATAGFEVGNFARDAGVSGGLNPALGPIFTPSLFQRILEGNEQDREAFPQDPVAERELREISEAGQTPSDVNFDELSFGGKVSQTVDDISRAGSAALSRPRGALSVAARSLPVSIPTIGSGAAAALAGAPAAATAGVAGLGSLATEYLFSVNENVKGERDNEIARAALNGSELSPEAALELVTNDPETMGEFREFALKRGVPIGVLDGLSFGVAGRLAGPAFRGTSRALAPITRGATGSVVNKAASGTTAAAAELAAQALAGGAGEALAGLASTGRVDAGDTVLEAVAEIPTALVEAPVNAISDARKARSSAEAERARSVVEEADIAEAEQTDTTKAIPDEPTPSQPQTRQIFTPENDLAIDVEETIVEASDLISSSDANFPKALQPRDRSRIASEAQINDIASNFNPEFVLDGPTTDSGPPIVADEEGVGTVVESGNGRTAAIRQLYERGLDEPYRAALEARGHDTSAFESPVLVRRRVNALEPGQRERLARGSNVDNKLGLSITEQAEVDAAAMGDEIIQDFKGGDVTAVQNRDFVQKFVKQAVSTGETATFINSQGQLSQDGVRRISAAIVAKAFGGGEVVGRALESTDDNTRSITGAMLSVAPRWAALMDDIKQGRVAKELDITPDLLSALQAVSHARDTGQKITDVVSQEELFEGQGLSLNATEFVEAFFNHDMSRAASRKAITDFLGFYIEEAEKARIDTGNLFGSTPADPSDILDIAQERRSQTAKAGNNDQTSSDAEQIDGDDGARSSEDGSGEQPSASRETGDEDASLFDEQGSNTEGSVQLNANPVGPLAQKFFGTGEEWQASIGYARTAAKSAVDSFSGRKINGARDFLYSVTHSYDGAMRARARVLKSPTLDRVLDQFFASAGVDAEAGMTLDEAMSTRINQRHNALDQALEDVSTKSGEVEPHIAERLIKLVQNPKTIIRTQNAPKLHKSAADIESLLAEDLQYMRDAGVEVGEIKDGYFPREFNVDAVAQSRDKFIAQAALAYRMSDQSMSAQSSIKAAKNLFDEIVFGGLGIPGQKETSAVAAFTQSRTWVKAADDVMSDFLVKDLQATMGQYIIRSTRRAEVARRFGDNWSNWSDIKEGLINDGAEEIIRELTDYANYMVGNANVDVSTSIKSASNLIRTWTTLGVMEKATLASLAETIVPALRTGNPLDAARGIKNTVKAIMRRGDRDYLGVALAEDFGFINGVGSNALMASRFAGGDPLSQGQSKVQASYFRRTFLEQFTNGTRVSAMQIGNVFLRRLSKELLDGKLQKEFYLGELGVPHKIANDFAKYVSSLEGRIPTPKELESQGAVGDAYRTALTRFVDQSVMRPNAATRPKWATHPIGAVIFQLQAFLFAFHKNVLGRTARLIRSAKKGELDRVEAAKLISSQMLMGFPMILAAQYAVGEMRDELFGDPDRRRRETAGAKLEKAWSRAGYFGAFDPVYNTMSGVRYQRSLQETLSGPALGNLFAAGETVMRLGLQNAETTNTQERKAAKAAYDFVIEPLANLALTAAPVNLGTGIISTIALPSQREAFVDALAGRKEHRRRHSRKIEGLFEKALAQTSRERF